jgi:hypothetical protein
MAGRFPDRGLPLDDTLRNGVPVLRQLVRLLQRDEPFCSSANHCGDECPEFGPCPGPAIKQRQERFRVCFNALGQSCTEYQRTLLNLGCGC